MATAISATYMNIPLIHIQGGEVTGNIDEKVRHAITKLADLHLVASEDARERVIKMGEYDYNVINTGCPSIDIAKEVLGSQKLDFDPFKKYGGVGEMIDIDERYLVVMQHPVTTEFRESRAHVEETLQAIYELGIPTFWFWPNVDAGADGTSKGLRSFREKFKANHIHFFKNMEPLDFLKLLYHSKCLIGNSSVGIRECAYLGIPVVNIGTRQSGRDRGLNVIDVDYDKEQIKNAIEKHLDHGMYPSDNIYGNGNAGTQIAETIAEWKLSFDKKIVY
jgi:UDP-hydrolysing UDP-N-acetyl-D-glucosamine 2-epimerase